MYHTTNMATGKKDIVHYEVGDVFISHDPFKTKVIINKIERDEKRHRLMYTLYCGMIFDKPYDRISGRQIKHDFEPYIKNEEYYK